MYEQALAADSTTATMDEWLTPKEICSLLQIPEQTFSLWRAKCVGPRVYRIDRHLRVTRQDLNAWLAQRTER